MSSRLGPPARLIWSLATSNLGTFINGNGNSGGWPTPASPPFGVAGEVGPDPNRMTPVDLRDVEDVWITAIASAVAGAGATLTVSLNQFDNQGNAYLIASLTGLTGNGAAGAKQLAVGKHGAAANTFAVFSAWGQVSWVVAGTTPSFTGVEIEVWAR